MGGCEAKASDESTFTQANTLDEIRAQVRDSVRCHFDESTIPKLIRLHSVRDEVTVACDSRGTFPAPSLRKRWRELVLAPRIAVQDPRRVGTLAAILADIAAHRELSPDQLLKQLFD